MAIVTGTDASERIGPRLVSRTVVGIPGEDADTITGGLGNDLIDAAGGDDLIFADRSGTVATGRLGNDRVLG
ncbi:MAG: hypothetical protein N3D77_05675, partial [Geminicoccaceae bacterium]|nr:hypothetical protein [Geminicoccaceae bacterium]